MDAGGRGGDAGRPGAEAAHLSARIRPDGAVPVGRRRRRLHGAEFSGRRRPVVRASA